MRDATRPRYHKKAPVIYCVSIFVCFGKVQLGSKDLDHETQMQDPFFGDTEPLLGHAGTGGSMTCGSHAHAETGNMHRGFIIIMPSRCAVQPASVFCTTMWCSLVFSNQKRLGKGDREQKRWKKRGKHVIRSNLFPCSVQALGAGVTFAIVFRTQLAWNRPAEMRL